MAFNAPITIPDLLSKITGPAPAGTEDLVLEIRQDLQEAGVVHYIDDDIPQPKHDIWISQAENYHQFMAWFRIRFAIQDYLLAKAASWPFLFQRLEQCGWVHSALDPRQTYLKLIQASTRINGGTAEEMFSRYRQDFEPHSISTGGELANHFEVARDILAAHGYSYANEDAYINDALRKMRAFPILDELEGQLSALQLENALTWYDMIDWIAGSGLLHVKDDQLPVDDSSDSEMVDL